MKNFFDAETFLNTKYCYLDDNFNDEQVDLVIERKYVDLYEVLISESKSGELIDETVVTYNKLVNAYEIDIDKFIVHAMTINIYETIEYDETERYDKIRSNHERLIAMIIQESIDVYKKSNITDATILMKLLMHTDEVVSYLFQELNFH